MIDAPAAPREKVEAWTFRSGTVSHMHWRGPVEVLTVRVGFTGFDDWWEPFTLGVGPAGNYVAGLDPQQTADLKANCASLLPPVRSRSRHARAPCSAGLTGHHVQRLTATPDGRKVVPAESD